ncbi:MAG: M14 family zinc carboxypeptidase [Pseudomonadota bacterium]
MTDFSHSGWRALRWLATGSLLLAPLAVLSQADPPLAVASGPEPAARAPDVYLPLTEPPGADTPANMASAPQAAASVPEVYLPLAEPPLDTTSAPVSPPAVVHAPPTSVPGACAEFVRWLPNVSSARCRNAGLVPSSGRSVQGRTIFVRDIDVPQPRLKVLVIGAIHGDEMSSASMVLHWIGLAGANAAGVRWRFIPALNPDGLFRQPAQRVNARGIDLNRNFPTPDWARQARIYWEQRTQRDPRRFPGTTPLSEPESRFLHSEMDAFQPNLIVSIHAPYGVLDFDGPSVEPPRRLGSLYLDQVGIYPGSLGNYGGVHRRMPVVTIELPSSEATPRDAEMQRMWTDLLAWMGERLAAPVRPAPVQPFMPVQPPAPPAALPSPPPAPAYSPEPLPSPPETPASVPEPVPSPPAATPEPAASAASAPQ